MYLSELEGTYDSIFSLGELCVTSIQLERNGLRPFSGVLDWVGSPNLSDVNRLLKNRFSGFMNRDHLRTIGTAGEKLYLVQEGMYNILSNHDFFIHQNDPEKLETYPKVKQKYDRRVARFLEKVVTGKRLLFIRTGGTYEEVEELQETLSELVTHDFNLLFLNPGPVTTLQENNWTLARVCSINVPPMETLWTDNDHLWEQLFNGIKLEE
jgi:hypothetical protein